LITLASSVPLGLGYSQQSPINLYYLKQLQLVFLA
jgi:hypothetical protein